MLFLSDTVRKFHIQDSAPDSKSAMIRLSIDSIVWGINTGNIHGDVDELRELILSNLAVPDELAQTSSASDESVMCDLFNSYDKRSSEIQKNIIYAFRVLFEKTPKAVISSVTVLGRRGEVIKPPSAIERMSDFGLLDSEQFYPELLKFIREDAKNFSEIELRRLSYGIHNKPVLMGALIKVFEEKQVSHLERGLMTADEVKTSIEKNWHPDKCGDFNFFYDNFPTLEVWRLLMDGRQQKEGWGVYEAREKGCINKLYQAFHEVRNTKDEPLTPNYFKLIHKLCYPEGLWLSEQSRGQYRDRPPSFGVDEDSMTFLGYLYHLQEFTPICSLTKKNRLAFDVVSSVETDKLDTKIEEFIRDYERAVISCRDKNDPEGLLKALILLCKKLVLIHPFADCNGRLFCNLILNRELVRHGFSPVLLDNPNRIDGYSLNEVLYELIRGMNSFQHLIATGCFKDTMKTCEVIKTHPYPIPELSALLDPSNHSAAALVHHGLFRNIPQEKEQVGLKTGGLTGGSAHK